MVDIQSNHDDRNIPIDQVGVSDLRYPIIVLDKKNDKQRTVANISMSVNLPHNFKGTHMSRFVEILNRHRSGIAMYTLPTILHDLKRHLKSESARVELSFPYFLEKRAPVSRARGLMEYECSFIGESGATGDDFIFGVKVPVTSLCPCSKAMSAQGAHNQRGHISIDVRAALNPQGRRQFVWIEELIDIAETSASAPVYSLLKRSDEKFVTDQAYANPMFVEDIVRTVAFRLKSEPRISWYRIKSVNHESIHNHSAFAIISHHG
ncbi:MAG: GTP cyclohydrolase FolE2 [Desulfuromonadaceae bacterium]|nr:GTP cyclohydrolase FolE2 [Desulfuromonadaceae bacterium]